jgi:hypothetical protein
MTSLVTTDDNVPAHGDHHDKQTGSEKVLSPSHQEQAKEPQAQFPVVEVDGGYGWVCVGACFLVNFHTWGLNSVRFIQNPNFEAFSNVA